MGNYKFRLADMMPNAWFYKLRDMSNKKPRSQKISTSAHSQSLDPQKMKKKKKKKNTTFPNSSPSSTSSPSTTTTTTVSFKPSLPYTHSPRKSYYFTRDCPNSPKRHPISPQEHQTQSQTQNQTLSESPRTSSSKNKLRKRRQPPSKQCQKQLSARDDRNSLSSEYSPEKEYSDEREFRCDRILPTDTKTCPCHDGESCIDNDIVIDVGSTRKEDFDNDSFSRVELPPIVTKPPARALRRREKQHSVNSSAPRSSSTITRTFPSNSTTNNTNTTTNSPGFRVRINNSPRIASKRFSGTRKSASSSSSSGNSRTSKSLSDSFAVVKTSFDPQRDFRESMVEMIVENNLRDSKDLEDLLACYLSLNSDEYHGVIIKVFKQIWFDLTDIK